MSGDGQTRILNAGDPDAVRVAAGILERGGLVAFPTETVYGLGADGLNAEAVKKIFSAKGRPSEKPLTLHVADTRMLHGLVTDVPDEAVRLMERFWPGPLTLVLRRGREVPATVTAGGETVGVRCPDHPVALALIRALGRPIAAPSANFSGRPSPTTAQDVLSDLAGRIDAVLDGGASDLGLESTIVDLTVTPPGVLRLGAVTVEEIRAVVPDLVSGVGEPSGRGEPKIRFRHYAPRAGGGMGRMRKARRLLFVCTGNTCRSPMAEAFARALAEQSGMALEAMSAGIAAWESSPATTPAVSAVRRRRAVSLAGHRARRLSADLVKRSDLILTMTAMQKREVVTRYPEATGKVHVLKEFAFGGTNRNMDIADPIGQPEDVYDQCAAELEDAVIGTLKRLRERSGQGGSTADARASASTGGDEQGEGKMRVIIGADHGGYRLKEMMKDWLREMGVDYEDAGTHSEESVDYPDLARVVAEQVADGDFDRGVLVCGTGIGMSITANKVPGIRAALVHDVFSARASRGHNDSNVLAMGERVIGSGLARAILEAWLGTEFEGGRHARRVEKISTVENHYLRQETC